MMSRRSFHAFTRALMCIVATAYFLYSYLDAQNAITKRRLEIPLLSKEIKELKEKNTCLQYEIDLFESPEHLMELSLRSEFAHLRQPFFKDILAIQQTPNLIATQPEDQSKKLPFSPFYLAVGAKRLSLD